MRQSLRGWHKAVLLGALVTGLTVLLVGCGSSGNKVVVSIEGKQYNPMSITVSVGTTVEWVNNDKTAHTVMGDQFDNTKPSTIGPNDLVSGPMNPGQTYEKTFTEPGVYKYHCMVHGYMHGEVIVK